MRNDTLLLTGFFALFICTTFGYTNDTLDQKKSLFDAFYTSEILQVQLETDLDSLLLVKNTNDFQKAIFSYTTKDGSEEVWDIKIRSRGKFRRRYCAFPPIKLEFSKKELEARNLKRHDDFKLVTHCLNDRSSDEFLLREFLVYQLYQRLTPHSFRAQLVRIIYKDIQSGKRMKRYGILLEDEKDVEDRFDKITCKDCFGWPDEKLIKEEINTHDLFQFMIANTDWSIKLARNIELFMTPDSSVAVVCPYDFDFSGFVNASYMIPNSDYGLTKNRQRKFIGLAKTEEELSDNIALFRQKKQELMSYIQSFKLLNKRARNDLVNFLETFYLCIEEGDFIDRIIDHVE